MTIQTINIGNVVNDGLGDDLRTAFQKVNANFSSLAAEVLTTGTNLGPVGSSVFKEKIGADLKFRKLVSGTKMFLDEATDSIIINNTSPDAFTRIDTDAGSMLASTFEQITLQGGDDVEVTAFGSVLTVNTVLPVTHILSSFDFGPINGLFETTTQLALSTANIDFGTITLPGTFNLDCGSFI
jgi:hypothetical protein